MTNQVSFRFFCIGFFILLIQVGVFAQNDGTNDDWTNTSSSTISTSRNVLIGTGSSTTYPFFVNTSLDGKWASRIKNENSQVFMAHQSGHGMYINSGAPSNGLYAFYVRSAAKATIIRANNNGNVGIGKNPSTKLDVQGRATCNTSFTIGQHNNNHRGLVVDNGASYDWRLMELKNVNGTHMVVNGTGNVGIGTATPENALDVVGTIRAEECLIETGWADNVFYDDYELPTLEEEEKHIEENGHLIGFESEQEMDGEISVGDVSVRQQVKIEEIILHLIDLKKEVEELKHENEELRAVIEK